MDEILKVKNRIGFKDDAKDERMIMPLTEVGSKSGSLVWEDENFGFGHVKFEVPVEHQVAHNTKCKTSSGSSPGLEILR